MKLVLCNRGDGMGLSMLRKRGDRGIRAIVRGKSSCPAGSLPKIGYLLSARNRGESHRPFGSWRINIRFRLRTLSYVGNDLNDLACMPACGMRGLRLPMHIPQFLTPRITPSPVKVAAVLFVNSVI